MKAWGYNGVRRGPTQTSNILLPSLSRIHWVADTLRATEKETKKKKKTKVSRERQRQTLGERLGPGPGVCPAAGGRGWIFLESGSSLRTGYERGTGVSSHGSPLELQARRGRGCCCREQGWCQTRADGLGLGLPGPGEEGPGVWGGGRLPGLREEKAGLLDPWVRGGRRAWGWGSRG